MLTIGMLILAAIAIGVIVARIALRINGDDNSAYPHGATSDDHRWEE